MAARYDCGVCIALWKPHRDLCITLWCKSVCHTQIYTRDIRPPISPRVMTLQSWYSILGSLGFCRPCSKNQCVHDLPTSCGVLRVFYLHTRTPVDAVTYTPDKLWLFWLQEKTRRPPICVPYRDEDGAGSWISGVYLWCHSVLKKLLKISSQKCPNWYECHGAGNIFSVFLSHCWKLWFCILIHVNTYCIL